MIWNVPQRLLHKSSGNGMTKKNPKIPTNDGDEYDAFGYGRQMYCYLARSGVAKRIKRKYNKRFRKEGKKNLDE
jgi:hypothetical protein